MNRFKSLLYFILLFCCSCNDKKSVAGYLSKINVHLNDDFTVDSIHQDGYKDWNLRTTLSISNNDKVRLNKLLLSKVKFDTVAKKPDPSQWFRSRKIDTIIGKTYGNTLFYKEFKAFDNGHTEEYVIVLKLNSNKLLFDYFGY